MTGVTLCVTALSRYVLCSAAARPALAALSQEPSEVLQCAAQLSKWLSDTSCYTQWALLELPAAVVC